MLHKQVRRVGGAISLAYIVSLTRLLRPFPIRASQFVSLMAGSHLEDLNSTATHLMHTGPHLSSLCALRHTCTALTANFPMPAPNAPILPPPNTPTPHLCPTVFEQIIKTASATDTQGYRLLPMYSTVSQVLFQATLGTFFGKDFATTETLRAFIDFDSQFPLLAGGAPRSMLASGLRSLSDLCDLLAKVKSYEFEDRGPDSGGKLKPLVRERRRTLIELENKGILTRKEHLKFQVIFIWAQLANTMPLAFWTLYYILKNPDAEAAVRAELQKCPGKHTRMLISNLPVLHSCILEAMRLTTGGMTVREIVQPFALRAGDREMTMRVGDRLVIFPPVMHFDMRHFPDPARYDWRRYLFSTPHASSATASPPPSPHAPTLPGSPPLANGSANGRLSATSSTSPTSSAVYNSGLNELTQHVMAFGGGESMCPGRHFAKNEIAQFVIVALLEYDIKLDSPSMSAPIPATDSSRVGLGIYSPERAAADAIVMLMRSKDSHRKAPGP
jgi:cholesterol 7alpha-monooxygenase